jgi:hypothetical protein
MAGKSAPPWRAKPSKNRRLSRSRLPKACSCRRHGAFSDAAVRMVDPDHGVPELKRYRSGAEQKVTLQHVSVAEGGQAIVGNVTQAPRENGQEKAAAPPPSLKDTNVVPMPILGNSKEHHPLSVRRKSNK